MKLYTVHAPPAGQGDGASDPLAFAFVKEGFCWPALFLPVIWILFRRLWLVLLVYLAIVLAFTVAGLRFDGPALAAAGVLFAFLFALEANELRRWTMARRGWRFLGVAEGRNRTEAELRFFAGWLADAPMIAEPVPPRPSGMPPHARRPGDDIIGVFPSPGGAA